MASKHLNITLPEELVAEMNSMVGPRERSAFISESLKAGLLKQKKEKLIQELKEGYLALAEEDLEINKEWETLDIEAMRHIDD